MLQDAKKSLEKCQEIAKNYCPFSHFLDRHSPDMSHHDHFNRLYKYTEKSSSFVDYATMKKAHDRAIAIYDEETKDFDYLINKNEIIFDFDVDKLSTGYIRLGNKIYDFETKRVRAVFKYGTLATIYPLHQNSYTLAFAGNL